MGAAAATAAPAPLLQLEGLGCQRDGRWLFRDLRLQLDAGECLELEGPNGSGKSTLIRVMAGLYPDYVGTLSVADCLYLGHRPGISALLTAAENLRWYAALQGSRVNVSEVLARVGMAGYERVLCQQMSAGQQRRVALARLLLGGGPVWLLDEPLTALDSAGQRLVESLIQAHLAQRGAVVCATHQPLTLAGVRRLRLGSATARVDAAVDAEQGPRQ